MFDTFAKNCLVGIETKQEQAEAIIWYHYRKTGENQITIASINQYFQKAFLPIMNVTRAKNAFTKSKNICRGSKIGYFKLTLQAIQHLDDTYGYLWETENKVEDIAGIFDTPYLTMSDIQDAQKMAKIYLVLNCYENSARALVEQVLQNKLGVNWWEIAANTAQKNKLKSRKETEAKHKWLTPRGDSPLYYVDWGDLLSIIRKYEPDFLPYIKEIKFVELRFEELEKIRNITAHNGYLPNDEDFQRVILSFRDWCRQLKI